MVEQPAAGVSRRALLRRVGALGLAAGAARLLAGCGGDGSVVGARSDGPARASGSPTAGRFPPGVRVVGPEAGPGVLLLHSWWGVTPGVLAWARRLGAAGARVIVPDLYVGKVAHSEVEAETLSSTLDDTTVYGLLDACATRLNQAGRWSALGWSLGAFHACQMMARGVHAPPRAVLFYGAAPPPADTRTRSVQLHVVPHDRYFTDSEITDAVDGLHQAEVSVQRFDYPGLRHWFAEPGSPSYDQQGTRVAQDRALSFLRLPVRG